MAAILGPVLTTAFLLPSVPRLSVKLAPSLRRCAATMTASSTLSTATMITRNVAGGDVAEADDDSNARAQIKRVAQAYYDREIAQAAKQSDDEFRFVPALGWVGPDGNRKGLTRARELMSRSFAPSLLGSTEAVASTLQSMREFEERARCVAFPPYNRPRVSMPADAQRAP